MNNEDRLYFLNCILDIKILDRNSIMSQAVYNLEGKKFVFFLISGDSMYSTRLILLLKKIILVH